MDVPMYSHLFKATLLLKPCCWLLLLLAVPAARSSGRNPSAGHAHGPTDGRPHEPTDGHAQRPNQPNIVFIMVDDLGWNDVGYHDTNIRTPNIDRLSSEGVRLESHYVLPICTPSRAQFLSGRHSIYTGVYKVFRKKSKSSLPLDSLTLADVLRRAGYGTYAVGKWHLGQHRQEYLPTRRGFDRFYGFYTGSQDHFKHRPYFCKKRCAQDLHDDGPGEDDFRSVTNATGIYSTHLYTQQAVRFIRDAAAEAEATAGNHGRDCGDSERYPHETKFESEVVDGREDRGEERLCEEEENKRGRKPFFLYLAYQAPHGPLQVPPEYEEGYSEERNSNRKTYAAMVTAMDEGIGQVVEELKRVGAWENTVLVFTSDNGGRRQTSGPRPFLRGNKGSLYEGGIRSVAFMASPLLEQKGYTSYELVDVADWFPTFAYLANASTEGTRDISGINQWDSLSRREPSQRTETLHMIRPDHVARGPPIKKYADTFDVRTQAALRVGNYKILTGMKVKKNRKMKRYQRRRGHLVQLYNIQDDPSERVDLSDYQPRRVREMLERLQHYSRQMVKPLKNERRRKSHRGRRRHRKRG